MVVLPSEGGNLVTKRCQGQWGTKRTKEPQQSPITWKATRNIVWWGWQDRRGKGENNQFGGNHLVFQSCLSLSLIPHVTALTMQEGGRIQLGDLGVESGSNRENVKLPGAELLGGPDALQVLMDSPHQGWVFCSFSQWCHASSATLTTNLQTYTFLTYEILLLTYKSLHSLASNTCLTSSTPTPSPGRCTLQAHTSSPSLTPNYKPLVTKPSVWKPPFSGTLSQLKSTNRLLWRLSKET